MYKHDLELRKGDKIFWMYIFKNVFKHDLELKKGDKIFWTYISKKLI